MTRLLFISHIPFHSKLHSRSTCYQRVFPIICSASPSESNSQSEDPEWMIKLAQNIAPNEKKDEPTRPPPKWTYPNGEPSDLGDQNPWDLWNAAQSSEQELAVRDPKAETDFWRATARDLTSSSSSNSSLPIDETTNSSDVWKMARGVTGDMTSLQNRLLEELNSYNPDENRDQYRDIARQLVGPSNDEPSEDKDPVRTNDKTDAGAEWNPDVDWMRFDDVRLENKLAEQAAQRRSAEDAARQSMRERLDSESAKVDADISDTSTGLPVFDTNNSPNDAIVSIDGKVPGFIQNRFRSDGTYGSSWTGAQKEMDELQNQGIELRNPKADTDSWRLAAKEMIEDIPSLPVQSADTETNQTTDPKTPEPTAVDSNKTTDENESSLWSSWRQGSINWNIANSEIEERDPKKEVDIWRSSAREILSEDNDEIINPSSSTVTEESNEESNIWAQWRKANAKWEQSRIVEQTEESTNWNMSVPQEGSEKVDWGAGLGKTNSERSAWENWNRVGFAKGGQDKEMWWTTRSDRNVTESVTGYDDLPLVKKDETVSGEKDERIEKNTTVDEWRSIAKELSEDSQ